MSTRLFEIRWTPALEEQLGKWIAENAQIIAPAAEDFATPEMVARFVRRRREDIARAVRSLRYLLEAQCTALDCDVINAIATLRECVSGRDTAEDAHECQGEPARRADDAEKGNE
jgi:hypothetical protein